MKRITTLGLTVVMALMLTAVSGAGIASASWFTTEVSPTTLKGANDELTYISWGPSEIGCESSSIVAPLKKKANAVAEAAFMADLCTVFSYETSLEANGCKFILHPGTETSEGHFVGTFDIGPANCGPLTMRIDIFGCTVSFYPKTGLPVEYEATGAGKSASLDIKANAKGLKYTSTGNCAGSGESGSFRTRWQVSDYAGASQRGVHIAPQASSGVFVAGEKSTESLKLPHFEIEEYPSELSASASNIESLVTPAGSLECEEYGGSSHEMGLLMSELELEASYGGCYFDGMVTTVKMNGCTSLFFVANAGPPYVGSLANECGSEAIAVEFQPQFFGSTLCTIKLFSQSLGSIVYENRGTGEERYVVANIAGKNVKYSISGDPLCGKSGSYENGNFSGGIAMRGVK